MSVCCLCLMGFVCFLILQNFFPSMTKIVGTLGPKSRSVETISACLKAGMSGNLEICYVLFVLGYWVYTWICIDC